MKKMTLPFTKEDIEAIARRYPTPFYLYDEAGIRARARYLKKTMDAAGVPGFRNFFAVKALPNPSILRILHEEGMGLDCSSVAELELAARAGVTGVDIMFTSNNTTDDDFAAANGSGAIINFDDLSHVRRYVERFGSPSIGSCRYNPGNISFPGMNQRIIGKPSEAKFGMSTDQITQAYRELLQAGTERFGLHAMLLSNELDYHQHLRIAELLFELAVELNRALGVTFEFINLGGGLGVPYRPEQRPLDLEQYAAGLARLYKKYGLDQIGGPRVFMENGRWVTAETGYLITRVVNRKETYKTYIGVDATMANLMRPGMYGAYHHITVLGKEQSRATEIVDVAGSLCENNDKFAIDRRLPHTEIGDYLAIHTVGAHGHAMGFNYNGKLRSAELLLESGGTVRLIRRAETLNDLFATLQVGEAAE
ncbi:diaminopimelate decarboxylase [Candidatus Saccharibacteria bacterium]|nr:diaminopimelate decarboxylase [Candidatus Saccharibacteria bacterium]